MPLPSPLHSALTAGFGGLAIGVDPEAMTLGEMKACGITNNNPDCPLLFQGFLSKNRVAFEGVGSEVKIRRMVRPADNPTATRGVTVYSISQCCWCW